MKDEAMPWADRHARIRDSRGARFLDQRHQRTFSVNLFQMNAVALMDAAQRVHDPDHGMSWMSEPNRDAGWQAHRELHRHIHNFVASALTLVEHTRSFMRASYVGSDVLRTYEARAKATFASSQTAQFVQGLRNYFLHKGMPPTRMFLRYTNDSGTDRGGTTTTGVHFDTQSLLDWKDWKLPARLFLEQADGQLPIGPFVHEYTELVSGFHAWLEESLHRHHTEDLAELAGLQEDLVAAEAAMDHKASPAASSVQIAPFHFESGAAHALNAIADRALANVRKLTMRTLPAGFATDRPTVTIHQGDVVGPVRQWGQDADGQGAWVFMQREGDDYGLLERDYGDIDALIGQVMRQGWAREGLSRGYVETCFADWATHRFHSDGPAFHEALVDAARTDIGLHEVWAPIAHLAIEEGFGFGAVRIEPVTPGFMATLRAQGPPPDGEHAVSVDRLMAHLKKKMLGLAAVVVRVRGEPGFALESARATAHDTVRLLRFFSPAAPSVFTLNPVHLQGFGHIPTTRFVTLSDGAFRVDEGLVTRDIGFWSLSRHDLARLSEQHFDEVASLLVTDGLSAFATAVRAAILELSKAGDATDVGARLERCVSALESVFLKHDMEPRAHRITSRMAALLAHSPPERIQVETVARQAYWLRDKPSAEALSRRDRQVAAVFAGYTHHAIHTAVANIGTFRTTAEFIEALDDRG
jgi:hypothetical protein